MRTLQQLIQTTPVVGKLLLFAGLVILLWIFVWFVRRQLNGRIPDRDSRYRARKAVNGAAYLVMVLLFVTIYSENLSDITVALGVAGAGIAFALQEVIVSFAGWITIMVGNFYKTGDRIELGGIRGDVMDIGVLRTTLMETGDWVHADLYNGRIVMIANSHVFKQPVFNLSGRFPFLWDEIHIPIAFGSDYRRAGELFEAAARDVVSEITANSLDQWTTLQKRYYLEDAQTTPMVTMTITANWVEFTLRYVVPYRRRRQIEHRLHRRILDAVEASGGRIRFGTPSFHLTETPVSNGQLAPDPRDPESADTE